MFISKTKLKWIESLLRVVADNTAYIIECNQCGCLFKNCEGNGNIICKRCLKEKQELEDKVIALEVERAFNEAG